MDAKKVDAFLADKGSMFATEDLETIRQSLLNASEDKMAAVEALGYKSPILILILALVTGGWAVDRFMLGDTKMAIIKLITCGGCGIWTIADWFSAMKRAREYNKNLFESALA